MKPSNDREAISLILSGLSAKGVSFTGVVEDTWCPNEITPTTTIGETVDLVTGVDEAWVYTDNPNGWLRFVLGNEPEEVLCDHTVNLSEFIDPIVRPWWE